jgi:hypothetical protein
MPDGKHAHLSEDCCLKLFQTLCHLQWRNQKWIKLHHAQGSLATCNGETTKLQAKVICTDYNSNSTKTDRHSQIYVLQENIHSSGLVDFKTMEKGHEN